MKAMVRYIVLHQHRSIFGLDLLHYLTYVPMPLLQLSASSSPVNLLDTESFMKSNLAIAFRRRDKDSGSGIGETGLSHTTSRSESS